MTEHQSRLFTRMLQEIKNYSSSRVNFAKFVGILEGIFDAAEIKDKSLIDDFYKHWTPLEVANGYYADTGKEPSFSDIEVYLDEFINFLKPLLK